MALDPVGQDTLDAYRLDLSAIQQLNEAESLGAYVRKPADINILAAQAGKNTHSAEMLLWSSVYRWNAIARQIKNLGGVTANTIGSHHQMIRHTVNVLIPTVHNYAADRVNEAVVILKAYSAQQSQAAYTKAHSEIISLAQTVTTEIQQLRQQITAEISGAVAQLTAGISALAAKEQADIAQAETQAAAVAQQAAQQAESDLKVWADQVASAPWAAQWAEIVAGVTAVLTQLGTDHPDLARQLKVIITTEPATLAEAEAAAAAAVPPMLTALSECVIPDCQDLNQLRNTLHNLADIALFALLLAWLVQMVTDPQGWAAETYAVLGPLVDAELTVVRGVLGI